jgi:hypothetical protein
MIQISALSPSLSLWKYKLNAAYRFGGMFMTYLHTKCYMLTSSGSLVSTNKPKSIYKFYVAAIFLFYITHTQNIKFQGSVLSISFTSVAVTDTD